MDSEPSNDDIASIEAPFKLCPLCGNPAEIVGATGYGFGIRCRGCGVSYPAIYKTRDEVVALWNRRSGTASAFGGRATKGKCSRRKLRAARRNLRKAREQKQLKGIYARIEALMPQLQEARAVELAEAEKALAESRTKLKALEPAIMADPALAELYDLIRHNGSVHHCGDSPS
jgi:hypothetical protein